MTQKHLSRSKIIKEAEKNGNMEIAEKYLEKLDSIKNKCERIGPESEELNLISEIREKSSSLAKEE